MFPRSPAFVFKMVKFSRCYLLRVSDKFFKYYLGGAQWEVGISNLELFLEWWWWMDVSLARGFLSFSFFFFSPVSETTVFFFFLLLLFLVGLFVLLLTSGLQDCIFWLHHLFWKVFCLWGAHIKTTCKYKAFLGQDGTFIWWLT